MSKTFPHLAHLFPEVTAFADEIDGKLRRTHRRRSDCRISHAVAPGLEVTSETPFETWVRPGRDRKVVPAEGAMQRRELAHFSVSLQRVGGHTFGVVINNVHFD